MEKTNIVKKAIGKLIALFLTIAMMGDVLGVLTVNAVSEGDAGNVSNQILKGTPVLDGQVDDSYKQSLTLYQGAGVDGAGGVNAYEDDPTAYTDFWNNTAEIYFLCDTDYLYICADVMDDSVESRGLEYVQSDYNGGPWMNDNCEFRLSLDGGNNTIKVGIDAYGLRCYGLTANMEATDYSKILYKTNLITFLQVWTM